MINVDKNELMEALVQLDRAIYNHGEWFDAITRTLVCRLPHDPKDVAPDAHRQCRLGQWYYGSPSDTLLRHPGFVALEAEHKDMHRQAARLLQEAASGAPIPPSEFDGLAKVLDRVRAQLQTLKRELEDTLHNLDSLTGASTRVGMLTKLREQQAMVKRRVHDCCVVMMDVDHFKTINDTHGHQAGDRVLAAFTGYLKTHLRPYDQLFRYGGEEFLICMPGADAEIGHKVVERMRMGLAATPIEYDGKTTLLVTASFGIALLDPGIPVEQTIERADKAMYAAKTAGRNCTRAWDSTM